MITTILKYLKYYIPGLTGILFIVMLLMGENYPTYFFCGFSLFIIVGNIIFPRDKEIENFSTTIIDLISKSFEGELRQ